MKDAQRTSSVETTHTHKQTQHRRGRWPLRLSRRAWRPPEARCGEELEHVWLLDRRHAEESWLFAQRATKHAHRHARQPQALRTQRAGHQGRRGRDAGRPQQPDYRPSEANTQAADDAARLPAPADRRQPHPRSPATKQRVSTRQQATTPPRAGSTSRPPGPGIATEGFDAAAGDCVAAAGSTSGPRQTATTPPSPTRAERPAPSETRRAGSDGREPPRRPSAQHARPDQQPNDTRLERPDPSGATRGARRGRTNRGHGSHAPPEPDTRSDGDGTPGGLNNPTTDLPRPSTQAADNAARLPTPADRRQAHPGTQNAGEGFDTAAGDYVAAAGSTSGTQQTATTPPSPTRTERPAPSETRRATSDGREPPRRPSAQHARPHHQPNDTRLEGPDPSGATRGARRGRANRGHGSHAPPEPSVRSDGDGTPGGLNDPTTDLPRPSTQAAENAARLPAPADRRQAHPRNPGRSRGFRRGSSDCVAAGRLNQQSPGPRNPTEASTRQQATTSPRAGSTSRAQEPGTQQRVSTRQRATTSPRAGSTSRAQDPEPHRRLRHGSRRLRRLNQQAHEMQKGRVVSHAALQRLNESDDHLMILTTLPAPTVRPPSRMANLRFSSIAMGLFR